MKIISWNVNGLRACINKGFYDFLDKENPDIICLQEIKVQEDQLDLNINGYHLYLNTGIIKGYSGTLILTKEIPLNFIKGINDEYNDEGRVITLEYKDFYLVNIYTPNSKRDLSRLNYRIEFEDKLRLYLNKLKESKNVILCGDLNVAHNEIDLRNPKSNIGNSGFTYEERGKFQELLDSGFIDTFRYLNKDLIKYTWWSYMFKAREKNIGWRIDYFLVSNDFKDKIKHHHIYDDVLGSDHCPISIKVLL